MPKAPVQPLWNDSLTARYLKPRNGREIIGLVLHDTSGNATHNDTLYLANPGDGREVSVDFTVERLGSIWKLNPQLVDNYTIHAGRSTRFKGYTNAEVTRRTIGIEILHHHNNSQRPQYTDNQVDAVAQLVAWLVWRFKLTTSDITSHRAIITDGSRVDPVNFPWDAFWQKYWFYKQGGRTGRPME